MRCQQLRRRLHFRCPTCSAELRPQHEKKLLACVQGHAVSVAAEGHVHLLPAGRLPRRATAASGRGDSDPCIRARRAFFDAGGYSEHRRAVADEAWRALAAPQPRAGGGELNLLDAGCGEGAYLRAIEEASARAPSSTRPLQLWGTDISKLAVRLAAKRQREALFAVAKSSRLPFADGSFDVLLSCFAPIDWSEFERVLRLGGALVVVRGGPEHLMGLKALMYDESGLRYKAARQPGHERSLGGGLRLERQARVRTEERFEGAAAASLLPMTPFYWKATSAQQREIGAETGGIETVVDFECSVYRKREGSEMLKGFTSPRVRPNCSVRIGRGA